MIDTCFQSFLVNRVGFRDPTTAFGQVFASGDGESAFPELTWQSTMKQRLLRLLRSSRLFTIHRLSYITSNRFESLGSTYISWRLPILTLGC